MLVRTNSLVSWLFRSDWEASWDDYWKTLPWDMLPGQWLCWLCVSVSATYYNVSVSPWDMFPGQCLTLIIMCLCQLRTIMCLRYVPWSVSDIDYNVSVSAMYCVLYPEISSPVSDYACLCQLHTVCSTLRYLPWSVSDVDYNMSVSATYCVLYPEICSLISVWRWL